MSFLESPRFPETLSYGSRGGPRYSTTVIATFSGREVRNANWALARHSYDAAHAVKNTEDLRALLEYFHVVQGRANGFRFKDFADFNTNGAFYLNNWTVFGTFATGTSDYQLQKKYHAGTATVLTRNRTIYKPVSGTVEIGVGGSDVLNGQPSSTLVETTNYTIDHTTGIVTITSGASNGQLLWWRGEFDVPVRFDVDLFETSFDAYEAHSVSLPLVEIRGTDLT